MNSRKQKHFAGDYLYKAVGLAVDRNQETPHLKRKTKQTRKMLVLRPKTLEEQTHKQIRQQNNKQSKEAKGTLLRTRKILKPSPTNIDAMSLFRPLLRKAPNHVSKTSLVCFFNINISADGTFIAGDRGLIDRPSGVPSAVRHDVRPACRRSLSARSSAPRRWGGRVHLTGRSRGEVRGEVRMAATLYEASAQQR